MPASCTTYNTYARAHCSFSIRPLYTARTTICLPIIHRFHVQIGATPPRTASDILPIAAKQWLCDSLMREYIYVFIFIRI